MTYEELVDKARELFGRADASSFNEHVAYQFNITGEAEGAFYLEVADGEIHIEPFEYFDRDVLFTTTADSLIQIGLGKLDPIWAHTTGKLKMEGSIEKALMLKNLTSSLEKYAKEMEKEQGSGAAEAKEGSDGAGSPESAEGAGENA